MIRAVILIAIIAIQSLLCQIPTNGLVAYYPFNGNANDLSENAIHGTNTNATLSTDRFGNTNSAYSFDGTMSYIELPASSKFGFNNSFSINLWVSISESQNNKYAKIFEKYACPFVESSDFYGFGLNGDSLLFGSRSEQGVSVNSSHKLFEFNKFVMLTGVKNYTTHKMDLFVNGFLVNSIPLLDPGTNSSIVKISIGKQTDCATKNPIYFFKGAIDDIRIYNRALTKQEINALLNENNCIQKVEVTDTLRISPSVTAVNSLPLDFGKAKIYPNPTRDVLNIDMEKPSNDYRIRILNQSGSLIVVKDLKLPNIQISLLDYPKGLYFIQVINVSDAILETKKLILE